MNIRQRKALFLINYEQCLNKTEAMKDVMSPSTLYKYISNDDKFKQKIEGIESAVVYRAEAHNTYTTSLHYFSIVCIIRINNTYTTN